eukprot:7382253-Prymnesium_polylepis.1
MPRTRTHGSSSASGIGPARCCSPHAADLVDLGHDPASEAQLFRPPPRVPHRVDIFVERQHARVPRPLLEAERGR